MVLLTVVFRGTASLSCPFRQLRLRLFLPRRWASPDRVVVIALSKRVVTNILSHFTHSVSLFPVCSFVLYIRGQFVVLGTPRCVAVASHGTGPSLYDSCGTCILSTLSYYVQRNNSHKTLPLVSHFLLLVFFSRVRVRVFVFPFLPSWL